MLWRIGLLQKQTTDAKDQRADSLRSIKLKQAAIATLKQFGQSQTVKYDKVKQALSLHATHLQVRCFKAFKLYSQQRKMKQSLYQQAFE